MPLSPRLKWKITRYQQKMDDRLDRARSFFRTVWNPQRMCPACRALVDRKERVCPFCGETMSAVASAGLGRMISLVLPEQGRITILLLTANVLLYALTWVASMRELGGEMDGRSLLGSIDGYTLVRFGAKYGPLIALGEWWRFVTPIFLHGGLLHLGMNSWVLYDLGPAVEALYGRQKFLVLYVLTGIAGVVASFLWRPSSISIGASGAIFGLIGSMIAYGYRNRRTVGDPVRNMFVKWAIYALLFGFLVPGLDNAAHIGGLMAGMAFGWLVPQMPSVTSGSITFWKVFQGLLALLVLVSFAMVALHPPA
jgi:rhomboid protease GluP